MTDEHAQGDHPAELKPYYSQKFQQFDANGGNFAVTWNWPAFFLGWIWYFSKGMAAKGFFLLGIQVVSFLLIGGAAFLLIVGALVYSGIFGNYDYYLLRRKSTQWWG